MKLRCEMEQFPGEPDDEGAGEGNAVEKGVRLYQNGTCASAGVTRKSLGAFDVANADEFPAVGRATVRHLGFWAGRNG